MQDTARGHLVPKWENIRKVIIKTDSRLLICYLQISLDWETAAGDQLQSCSLQSLSGNLQRRDGEGEAGRWDQWTEIIATSLFLFM